MSTNVLVYENGKAIKKKTPELLNNLKVVKSVGGFTYEHLNVATQSENLIYSHTVQESGEYQIESNVRAFLKDFTPGATTGAWRTLIRVNGVEIMKTYGANASLATLTDNGDNTVPLRVIDTLTAGDVVEVYVIPVTGNGSAISIVCNDGLTNCYFSMIKVGGYE